MADAGDLVSLTPYNYSFNNPIRYNDPYGDCPTCTPSQWEYDATSDGQMGAGLVESVSDAAVGLWNAVTNPVETVTGLWNAVTNPVETAVAIKDQAVSSFNENPGKFMGKAVGNIFMTVATAGISTEAKVTTEVAKVTKTVNKVEKAVHGNSKLSDKLTTLYKLETKQGEYLKTGVTSKPVPEKRYTNTFMKDKQMKVLDQGNRADMLKKERGIVETQPGPLNKEPWAGKKLDQ